MRAAMTIALAALALATTAHAQAPAPAATAGEPTIVYPVKPKDNLYTIAGQYFVSRAALVEVSKTNHLKRPALLPNGLMLQIPVRLLKTTPVEAVLGVYRGGVTVAPFTTFAGLYDRATGEEPFDLDARWIAAKAKLTPDTVFNISSTNDIIGGNSGSPLINAKTEVIGAVFDGNIHSLGGDYGYDGSINRSVTVSTTAISEALAKVYGAQALAAELAGS